MVDLVGHVAFVALAAVASLLPDMDLWLVALFPGAVHHHGVTHTVLPVTVVALVGGVVAAALFVSRADDWVPSERFDRRSLFVFTVLGLLAGGLSHVFADMLSAPDISTPIEPLWPLVDGSWGIERCRPGGGATGADDCDDVTPLPDCREVVHRLLFALSSGVATVVVRRVPDGDRRSDPVSLSLATLPERRTDDKYPFPASASTVRTRR